MSRSQARFLFLNVGHFLDHLLILIFATAAALRLGDEWGIGYAALIPYATPGFVAFGVCAIPAGWLADKWSREGMMVIFFVGIGASAILAGFASTPLQMAMCLTLMGTFAAIYHPVGLAMVVQGRRKTGVPVAVNGVFGNMGVATAALLTGALIDTSGWRAAFLVPGTVAIGLGLLYLGFERAEPRAAPAAADRDGAPERATGEDPGLPLVRLFAIIFFTTAIGGLVFQSTTFSLPRVLDERLAGLAGSATLVGGYAFVVFSMAAFAQLAVGYLIDRYSLRAVFAGVALMQAICLGAMVHLEGVAALLVALGFMLAVFGQIPINDVLVGRIVRSEWRARAYALRYIVTFSVSASAVPLIAWIYGGWGFGALFVVLSAAALLVFTAVLLLPRASRVTAGAALAG